MLHLHYTGAVTVTKLRTFKRRNGNQGTALHVRTADETYEYQVAESLNGSTPQVGQVVGLILEAFNWQDADVSAAGKPYIKRTILTRVVGTFDPEKANLPKLAAAA